jgi:dihydropyrimidinase
MTMLIKNGTVISPTGRSPADVLVDGEQIVALLAPGSGALGDVEQSAIG